jgi:hypothetical protein
MKISLYKDDILYKSITTLDDLGQFLAQKEPESGLPEINYRPSDAEEWACFRAYQAEESDIYHARQATLLALNFSEQNRFGDFQAIISEV